MLLKTFGALVKNGVLDFLTFGRLGLTCKYFYKETGNEKFWKNGCHQIFDPKSIPELLEKHGLYKNIFIRTPKE